MASSQLAHRRRFFLVRNRFLAFGPRVCSSGPVATLSVATDLRQLRVPHPPRLVRRVGVLTLFFAFRFSSFAFRLSSTKKGESQWQQAQQQILNLPTTARIASTSDATPPNAASAIIPPAPP